MRKVYPNRREIRVDWYVDDVFSSSSSIKQFVYYYKGAPRTRWLGGFEDVLEDKDGNLYIEKRAYKGKAYTIHEILQQGKDLIGG